MNPLYPFEARQVIDTWASRIVNRHNLWLEAVHKEEDGDIHGAILLYLRDAFACAESHNLPRAALSCSCAAHCLEKKGHVDIARILYAESANIFEQSSIESLDSSIRDAIWSLQRAYENFVLAKDEQHANDVYYLFTSLAAKVSPTYGRYESSELSKYNELMQIQSSRSTPVQPLDRLQEILKVIRGFLELRNSDFRLAEIDRLTAGG